MIHIKETEIIPFLKTAQTGYTKMISEGDLEMEVELAEKVEEALTQAMDIIYDYQSMADEHKRMVEKYETEAPVIKRGMDFYCCPACGKRTSRLENHPQDSRVTIAEDGNVPTLTSRMGTGGAMYHSSSANHIADQKRM